MEKKFVEMNGKKRAVYILRSKEDILEFAMTLSKSSYYTPMGDAINDETTCSGALLWDVICNSSIDYDEFFGEWVEFESEFFYFLEDSYEGDTEEVIASSAKEAIKACFKEFRNLCIFDKKRHQICARMGLGLAELSECKNESDIIGFALRYNARNYFCDYGFNPIIVKRINNYLSSLDEANVFEEAGRYYYQDYIEDKEDILFKVEIDARSFIERGEIFLEEDVYVSRR